jgi:hypothetical protein
VHAKAQWIGERHEAKTMPQDLSPNSLIHPFAMGTAWHTYDNPVRIMSVTSSSLVLFAASFLGSACGSLNTGAIDKPKATLVRATAALPSSLAPIPTSHFSLDAALWPAPDESSRLDIMVVGDSTADCLGWGLRTLQSPGLVVELEGKDGCELLRDTCDASTWAKKTKELRPKVTLLSLGGAFLYGVTANGEWQKSCKPDWDATFESHLMTDLRELKGSGVEVWALTVPYPLGSYDTKDYRAEVDCINTSIRKSASAVGGISILDLAENICPRGHCARDSDGMVLRPDGIHYAIDALGPTSRWILDQVRPRAHPKP